VKKITSVIMQNFESHLLEEEKANATMEKYLRDIRAFMEWLGEQELCKTSVLKYKEYLTELYAPASVNSMLSSLNSFFQFNEWFDLKVKALKMQKQLFATAEKELTKIEYQRLLNAAKTKGNEKLYLLMQTICVTGIRISELRFITVESLNARRAIIHLKGKTRVIIIPTDLCKMLLRYAKEQKIKSGCIFVSRNGNPLDRSNIWKLMKALCEYARVAKEKVFPHNLRHLFARTFYTAQKDIVRLADILGHSSVNTTRIYTMETGDMHRKQIQRLGLLQC